VNKYFKLLFSALISILGIYLAFKGEDLIELWHQIQQVDWILLWISCLLLIFSCVIRAFRWQLLLKPVEHIPLHRLFAATMIGYFGNGVLIFRLGELLKAYSVSVNRNISTAQAFGTVILERIIDLLMVALIFAILIPWFPFEQNLLRVAMQIFSAVIIAIVVLIGIAHKFRWLDLIKYKTVFQSGFGEKVFNIVNEVFDGMIIIRKTRNGLGIGLTSVFLWGIYYVTTYILLSACGLDLGFIGTGIIFIIGSIAIGIPALPGSAGTYDAGVKYGLVAVFAIISEKALTYAIVSHAVSYFPLVIVGAVYFMLSSVKIKDLRERPLPV